MNFFNTFRGKLIVILAILLITTLGVQYYLNYQTEQENKRLRESQEQALVAGITLAVNKMVSQERMTDFIRNNRQNFFDKATAERIKDIIIIDNDWEINDSLTSPENLPKQEADNIKYRKLSELKDLPPLMDAEKIGEDRSFFPNANILSEEEREELEEKTDGEAHAIPIQTSQGRWYLIVILKTEKNAVLSRAAQPLIYTLVLLLASSIITISLVWRFTRPIAKLSEAAREVAKGDLSIRVPIDRNTDEMGKLATRFNEMTARLETTRELETKLQETEKSAVVGRLASAIAHEIRNPLNYINLTLDHLRAKFVPDDENKREQFEKLTSQLKTEVARINTQISDFLRYSRPLKLNLEPTILRPLIDDSLRIIEGQAGEQGIEIAVNQADNSSNILADGEVLRSVFNNLFINAMQAMPNGGNLNVEITSREKYVKIEVIDTGEGIPPENIAKIFEPYFSTKETGTGLGLAIVKRIIDEHHGTIEVESSEGTKFTVKIPVA
jgi:signal transduction histidine kinase